MVTIYCTACGASDEIDDDLAIRIWQEAVLMSGEDPPPPPVCLCKECREAMEGSGKAFFLFGGGRKAIQFDTAREMFEFAKLYLGKK